MNMRRMYQLTKGSVEKGGWIKSNEEFTLDDKSCWYYDGKTLSFNIDLIMAGNTTILANKEIIKITSIPSQILKHLRRFGGSHYVDIRNISVVSEVGDLNLMPVYIQILNDDTIVMFNKNALSSAVSSKRHFILDFSIAAL